jgi:hypothetical protein
MARPVCSEAKGIFSSPSITETILLSTMPGERRNYLSALSTKSGIIKFLPHVGKKGSKRMK